MSELTTGKKWLVTLFLCCFGGGLGLHRIYTGKVKSGIIMLVILSISLPFYHEYIIDYLHEPLISIWIGIILQAIVGCWALYDLIIILLGKFKDDNGNELLMPKVPTGNKWLVTLLLCLFLGGFGIHRIYVGKIKSGFGMLLLLIFAVLILIVEVGIIGDLRHRPGAMGEARAGFCIFFICSIVAIYDFIMILFWQFRDGQGNKLVK